MEDSKSKSKDPDFEIKKFLLSLEEQINNQEILLENINKQKDKLFVKAQNYIKKGNKNKALEIVKEKIEKNEIEKGIEENLKMLEDQKILIENGIQQKELFSIIKLSQQAIKEESKGLSILDIEQLEDFEKQNKEKVKIAINRFKFKQRTKSIKDILIQGMNIIKILYKGYTIEDLEIMKEYNDDIKADQEELFSYLKKINN